MAMPVVLSNREKQSQHRSKGLKVWGSPEPFLRQAGKTFKAPREYRFSLRILYPFIQQQILLSTILDLKIQQRNSLLMLRLSCISRTRNTMKCVWWKSLSSRKKLKIMQNRKYMESREMDNLEDTKRTIEQWPKGNEGDRKSCEQLSRE